MRITGVETVLYDYELSRPIGDVNIPTGMYRRTDLAVFIGTDEGPQGVAVASSLGAGAIPMLSEAVIGEDPLGHRGLWERMIRASFKPGNEGATAIGIAAIDTPSGTCAPRSPAYRCGGSSVRWSRASRRTPADWTARWPTTNCAPTTNRWPPEACGPAS